MTDEAIRIRDILAANNTVLNQNAIGNVTIDNQKRLIEGLEVVNPYEDENLWQLDNQKLNILKD